MQQKDFIIQDKCKSKRCDRSSDDDHDDMDDLLADSANTKGSWAKNKSKIDEAIHIKVSVIMDRNMFKTKINNLIEKRSSTIENVYNCGNDQKCEANSYDNT